MVLDTEDLLNDSSVDCWFNDDSKGNVDIDPSGVTVLNLNVDYSDSDTLQTIADIPEESAFYKFAKSIH